ncbi:hypothetical protein J3E69DRAFT_323735 [Trichoderma sp. SZMC 28015]
MDQLGYARSWTHLIQILRVPSTPYKALQLPQAFFPCLERRDTNLHEQARGSTSTNPGALSLLHVFALAPTDRGCYGKTCINTIRPQHRCVGRLSWSTTSPHPHGAISCSSPR